MSTKTLTATLTPKKVDRQKAHDWHQNFLGRQWDTIKTKIPGHLPNLNPYQTNVFVDLIKLLIGINNLGDPLPAKYSGVRVYLACYTDTDVVADQGIFSAAMLGHLTLIYVRTNNSDYPRDDDDPNYYVILDNGTAFRTITPRTAKKWVMAYEQTLLQDLIKLPGLGSNVETTQIWYSSDELKDTITDISTPTVSPNVTVFFTAYDNNEKLKIKNVYGSTYYINSGNQLGILFVEGTQPPPYPLLPSKTGTDIKKIFLGAAGLRPLADPGDSYDTGIPIPPGSNGGQTLP